MKIWPKEVSHVTLRCLHSGASGCFSLALSKVIVTIVLVRTTYRIFGLGNSTTVGSPSNECDNSRKHIGRSVLVQIDFALGVRVLEGLNNV